MANSSGGSGHGKSLPAYPGFLLRLATGKSRQGPQWEAGFHSGRWKGEGASAKGRKAGGHLPARASRCSPPPYRTSVQPETKRSDKKQPLGKQRTWETPYHQLLLTRHPVHGQRGRKVPARASGQLPLQTRGWETSGLEGHSSHRSLLWSCTETCRAKPLPERVFSRGEKHIQRATFWTPGVAGRT